MVIMCNARPGERCADETCEKRQMTLDEYIAAWPGAGRLPVDPVAATQAVLDLAKEGATQPEKKTEAARPCRLGSAHGAHTWGREAQLRCPGKARHSAPDLSTYGDIDPVYGPHRDAEGAWNIPDPQANEVIVDGRTFHRLRENVYANWPDSIRVEADRELSNDEVRRMGGIVGYLQRSTLRGSEPISEHIVRDGPNSFVVFQDATKTFSDDVGVAYEKFEDALEGAFSEGTPVRKTNRSGPGTAGTRAIEGVGDVRISIWYDDVVTDNDD